MCIYWLKFHHYKFAIILAFCIVFFNIRARKIYVNELYADSTSYVNPASVIALIVSSMPCPFSVFFSYISYILFYRFFLVVLRHYSIEHQILITIILQAMAVSRWAIMAVARIEYLHGIVILHGSNS